MSSANRKVFRLVTRVSKSFRLYVEGFTFAVTFLFRIRERIRITFASKARIKPTITINSRRIRSTYFMRLIASTIQTLSSRTIRLVFSPSEIKKAITTILMNNPITFVSKAIQKIMAAISQGKLRVLVSPTLAQFFTLGNYDPSTLGTLDTETLGDLDYIST